MLGASTCWGNVDEDFRGARCCSTENHEGKVGSKESGQWLGVRFKRTNLIAEGVDRWLLNHK